MIVGLMASFLPVHLVVVIVASVMLGIVTYAFLSYTDVRRIKEQEA